MGAYYNEFDPRAAAWLRELIKRKLIADGEVDERSILDVHAEDLRGFTQCHFFAGIGGWSYALRLAEWPDTQPVWTGSPPCQPFSAAGQQKGKEDERHLAPHFADLVAAGRPPFVFGEQVASSAVFGKVAKRAKKDTDKEPDWAWIDDLSDRLEGSHYAVGATDIPAAGVGAPHIRQRTFFGAVRLADAECEGSQGWGGAERGGEWPHGQDCPRCADGGLADASGQRHDGQQVCLQSGKPRQESVEAAGGGGSGRLGDADDRGQGTLRDLPEGSGTQREGVVLAGRTGRPRPYHEFWRDADWLFCRDGKWRPVGPGTFPLAHGVSARVVRLRGYGNAIVPQAGAAFIRSFTGAVRDAFGEQR